MEACAIISQAPSVAGFGARVGDLIAGPPEISIHGVSASNDYPDLEGSIAGAWAPGERTHRLASMQIAAGKAPCAGESTSAGQRSRRRS